MPDFRRAPRRALPAILALVLAAAAPAAGALSLDEVRVLGVGGEFEANVRARLSLVQHPAGESLSEAELGYLLRRAPGEVLVALEPFGFYDTRVEVTPTRQDDRVSVTVVVSPGRPVQVRSREVAVLGDGADDPVLTRRSEDFAPRPGEILDHRRYAASKAELQRSLLERGYFDAEPEVQRVEVLRAEYAADIRQRWHSGPRYAFGETRFSGGPVRVELLERMLDHEPGQPFHQDELVALHQRLAELEYFGHIDIQPDPDAAEDGRVPVDVATTPAKRSVYRAGLSYGTDTGAALRLGLQRRYVNELGHKLRADAELGQRERSLSGVYRIPAFQGVRGWWNLGASIAEEEFGDFGDSRIIEVAGVRTGRWRGHEAELGWHLRRERNDEIDTLLSYPMASVSRTRADQPLYPRDGYRYRATLAAGASFTGSDVDFRRLELGATWIRGLWPRGRLLLRGELGALDTGDFAAMPPGLRFYAGGDRSVRGYGYQEIGPRVDGRNEGGKRLLTASVELEHMLDEHWGVAGFVDAGDAWNSGGPDPRLGVGLGVRWRSPIGPVRVDVAVGLDEPDRPVRLHINIGPEL